MVSVLEVHNFEKEDQTTGAGEVDVIEKRELHMFGMEDHGN